MDESRNPYINVDQELVETIATYPVDGLSNLLSKNAKYIVRLDKELLFFLQ